MNHMRQLDSLRAFAVLAVFTNHWLPLNIAVLPWGSLGVQLFFVLSGFLITGILLEVRESACSGRYSVRHGLRQFYARRFLRIFPLFYATLAVGLLIGLPNVRASFPWHALYLSNFYVAFINHHPGETSHLWTLAAEEQFYLIWPCVILLLPKRLLTPAFAALVAVAILWRLVGAALRMNPFALQALPINTVDFFAYGAYLASLQRDAPHSIAGHPLFHRLVVLGAALLMLPGAVLRIAGIHEYTIAGIQLNIPIHWERTVVPTAAAVLFVNLIHRASRGFGGPVRRVLENPILLHMGKISYGLYLLHLPLLAAVSLALAHFGWPALEPRSWALFVPKVLLTVAVAMLTWHLFEKPLNALKRNFPY